MPQVELAATSGRPDRLRLMLRGWTWVSWHFDARARAVAALHGERPLALAYQQPGAYGFKIYSRTPVGAQPFTTVPTHTREKGWPEMAW